MSFPCHSCSKCGTRWCRGCDHESGYSPVDGYEHAMDEFPGNEYDCGVCVHADTDVCSGCVDGDKYKNEEAEDENT